MTVSDSSTIDRRSAILHQLPTVALFTGLDYYGGQVESGDWSVASAFAAYLDETTRRVKERVL